MTERAPSSKKTWYERLGLSYQPDTSAVMKVLGQFEENMATIIIMVWLVAAFFIGASIYTIHVATAIRQQADQLRALEPNVPKARSAPLVKDHLMPIVQKLTKRFQGVTVTANGDNTLTISSTDPAVFNTWMASVSYLDTLSPKTRWKIKTLCVGPECPASTLMSATIIGETWSFEKPASVLKQEEEKK